MMKLEERQRRLLEDAYDRGGDALVVAAYLLQSAIDALEHAEGERERRLSQRLQSLFDELRPDVFRRLDDTTMDLGRLPRE